ncbi:MAG TPA: TrmJ/YjtD family RNA methyltransferase [Spirochaetia bacterium]
MKSATDVRIVLVRPRDPRNVGAACRAMKCMGLSSLTIVLGGLIDPLQARVLAHNAEEVLDNALVVHDLRDAVADTVLVAGTTRRRGRNRKYFSLFPEQLGERIAGLPAGTVAVLFGNEETGLTDEELALCNVAVTIPTAPQLPSLNLSHAVQVICYEIFRARNATRLTPFTPVTSAALDGVVDVITGSLKAIGFFTLVGPENMGVFWKDILARAGLSVNEARRVETTFRKIAGLATKKGLPPTGRPS